MGELLDEIMENNTDFNEGDYKIMMETIMKERNQYPSKFIEGCPLTLLKVGFLTYGNVEEGMCILPWRHLDDHITALEEAVFKLQNGYYRLGDM